MNETLLTIPQAAKRCSLSRGTLWKYAKRGELRTSLTPGGQYRVHIQDLDLFMRQKGMNPFPSSASVEKKILIVDDDRSIRDFLTQTLIDNGYQTELARDGFEAGLRVMTFRPELVILDLFMPKLNGFDVCAQIKSNADTAHIKVLIFTGFDSPENRERTLRAGADGYLTKSVRKNDLIQRIEALIGVTKDEGRRTIG